MFDYINGILYKRSVDIDQVSTDSTFQPYMIQRWCSMYTPDVAYIINETTNRYWNCYTDKRDWFIALNSIIPRCSFKKLNYIKKIKNEQTTNQEIITKIAQSLEISTREVITYIKEHNLDLNLLQNET